jgi:hypothetical protein
MRRILAALIGCLFSVSAYAQSFTLPPGSISGAGTAGDLAAINSAGQVADSAVACVTSGQCNLPVGLVSNVGTISTQVAAAGCIDGFVCKSEWYFNIFDNTDPVTLAGGNTSAGLYVHQRGIGSGGKGRRIAIEGNTDINNTPSAASDYIGGLFYGRSVVNVGGTGGVAAGNVYGLNVLAQLTSSATFFTSIQGAELDIQSGVAVLNRIGISIVDFQSASVQGTNNDIALNISAISGATGWLTGINFSAFNGLFPISSGGTLIASATGTVAHGLDFSNLTCSTDCIKTPSFNVNGSGVATGASFIPTSSSVPSAGMYLGAANVVGIRAATNFYMNSPLGIVGDTDSGVQGGDVFVVRFTGNFAVGETIYNGSNGGSAKSSLLIGNDQATNQGALVLNSSGNSAGNGAGTLTLAGGAGVYIQGSITLGSSVGIQVNTSGVVFLPNIASSSVAQTGTVCRGAAGLLTYDTTTTCLLSSERWKRDMAPLPEADAISIAMQLTPSTFYFAEGYNQGRAGQQIGMSAERTALADERLISRGSDELPRGILYAQAVSTVAIGAIQNHEHRIAALEARVH